MAIVAIYIFRPFNIFLFAFLAFSTSLLSLITFFFFICFVFFLFYSFSLCVLFLYVSIYKHYEDDDTMKRFNYLFPPFPPFLLVDLSKPCNEKQEVNYLFHQHLMVNNKRQTVIMYHPPSLSFLSLYVFF